MQTTPIVKDLVLIGGGHSHVEVIKRFAMRPLAGVRLTVISREVHTPYSGMLPGLIAGHYDFDDAHIDLGPLVRLAGGRLFHDEVTSVDFTRRLITCRNRPPVSYDILSLDIGSAPNTEVPGANEFAIPVKPVSNFNQRWEQARERILSSASALRVGVVGGGAGGIELLLALRHHLRERLRAAGRDPDLISFHLIAASDRLLPSHNEIVQQKFARLLRESKVETILDKRVIRVEEGAVTTASGETFALEEIFWVTNAAAANWPGACGLATDERGFIRVHPTLESISHPGVYATGDVATVDVHPRPKSGVFAVRQGPPLADNLRRALLGMRLRPYKPQQSFLSLIGTGQRYAIGSKGKWAFEGRWVWYLKDWIDRRFMQKYRELPAMSLAQAPAPAVAFDGELHDLQADPMRCGGCGSKVGSDILSEALSVLKPSARADIIVGLDQPDDAAVVEPHPGTVLVQTVDSFRAFIDDPFVFGQVAANHCLSDIFAMGATPQTALAIVTLPLASATKMRDDLIVLMRGALKVFAEENTVLVGGHTNEGTELALGFAINGYIEREKLSQKGGARAGDHLILTKPLGTGVLFAGEMRGKAKTRWVESALSAMLQSNAAASRCLQSLGSHAITDVTGFGLFGHLAEMLRAANLSAQVSLDGCPFFDGATSLAADGILSSLQPNNLRIAEQITEPGIQRDDPRYQLCCDPQTAGGLLAAVPRSSSEECISVLREFGYTDAQLIGTVVESADVPRITLS